LSIKPFPKNMRPALGGLACALTLVTGCGDAEPPEAGGAGTARGEVMAIVPTLSVMVTGDSVRFTLRIANNGASGVDLTFGSGQRYDFVVSEAGEEIWRWSADRMFTQVVGEEHLGASTVLEYGESWDPGGREGVFRAIGRLMSSNHPVELETEFELGGG
jgi:hypothetical protein